METIVTGTTDLNELVGGTYRTQYFPPFELRSAGHAPELNAMAYIGRSIEDGYTFIAFLPYGQALISE